MSTNIFSEYGYLEQIGFETIETQKEKLGVCTDCCNVFQGRGVVCNGQVSESEAGFQTIAQQRKELGFEDDTTIMFGEGVVKNTKPNYLTFTANQDNSRITFMSWCEEGITPPEFKFEYRMGTSGEWMMYDFENPIDLEVNQTVQFRGINPNGLEEAEENYGVYCTIEGGICASGDLTSLINGVGGDIELPPYCFSSLFGGASGLLTAPSLPSTTLSEGCYIGLFEGCSSLTTAPELPAKTLVGSCYNNMFGGCISLNSIKCLATNVEGYTYTDGWVKNVAANGTFTKAIGANWTTGVNYGIPSGWTVQNEDGSIPEPPLG